MTIINGADLFREQPFVNMLQTKERNHGVSHGLGEAGYDIRIKQAITFKPTTRSMLTIVDDHSGEGQEEGTKGRFVIASAIDQFVMPPSLVGVVHDKSTWARRGLSVLNTVIEPGWRGFLTLELVYHGQEFLHIPAGAGIAQVLFHETSSYAHYQGKYQDQADRPVEAIHEES